LKKDFLPAAAAILLFLPLFALRRLGPADFWWWMGAGYWSWKKTSTSEEPAIFSDGAVTPSRWALFRCPSDDSRFSLALSGKAVKRERSKVEVGPAVEDELAQNPAGGGAVLKTVSGEPDGAEKPFK